MTPFVSGLVLAAGASTRLGRPKQLLPFRGTTLLGWVLARVAAADSLDELIVVVGGAAADVRSRVDLGRARIVENPNFGQGCASSYQAGLAALDPRSEAVTVLLGDQPGIEGAVIDHVVTTWRQHRDRITAATYQDRVGHPLVFARALFDRLLALKGDKAAWKILDAHPDWVRPVPVDRPFPADVNTWQEYEAMLGNAPDRPGSP
jgi:molybdenum cofactor cytidylyltransferase